MNDEILIGNHKIGKNNSPFIIAEMSGNHNGSIDRAFKIIDAALDAGAHAIKLQTYTAEKITINAKGGLFDINDNDSLWNGKNLFELYKGAYTPWEWHQELYNYAKKKGILMFSSVFDETGVDFLEKLDVQVYKIASFENNHYPLLKKIAQTEKPVIMSTGLSNISNLEKSVNTLKANGCKDLILLKCTSTYPSSPKNSNLKTIPVMKKIFDCQVGLSDHTLGIGVPLAAISLGATVIEKHFTLSRSDGGVDSAFSLEPNELKSLVEESKRAYQSLGKVFIGISDEEKKSLRFKRSIYVIKDIKKGEVLTKKNISIIRPGDGLDTHYYDTVLGRKAKIDISGGTPLSMKNI
ncbi:pseudaminic acid synthase [Flavobacteriaceae bacterium]|nr:pseudaminic acid synthase [Flavobacteriaceae bacterium]